MQFAFRLMGQELFAIEFGKSDSEVLDELIEAGSGDVEDVEETPKPSSYGFVPPEASEC